MKPNLLVSYDPRAGYISGKNEVQNILTKFGDQKAEKELLVPGIIGVETELAARDVVEDVRELYMADPSSVNSTVKWVPVDSWCAASIDEVKKIVQDDIKELIKEHDLFAIDVVKHKSELHREEVIEAIAPLLKGKVELDHPQKVIRIELFDKTASVTLLKPKDVFSVVKGQ